MSFYFRKCKKNTESINPRVSNTSNGKTMILSKCAISGNKKSKFIKEQEAKGLLSNLGTRTPLSKIPYWEMFYFKCNSIKKYCIINNNNNNNILLSNVWRKYKRIVILVLKAINGGTIILPKCAVCNTKNARFIKKQNAKGLLYNLGIRTLLSKILIMRDILF